MKYILYIFCTYVSIGNTFRTQTTKTNRMLNAFTRDITSTKVRSVEPFIRQKSYSELIKEIDNHEIPHIYFSEDLKKIFSDTKEGYDSLNDLSVTYSSPSFANTIVDSSRKSNTETFILQEPSNTYANMAVSTLGLLDSLFNTGVMFCLAISFITFFLRRNSGGMMGPGTGGPGSNPFSGFGNGGNNLMKDKENMQKANISLADWAGSPEIFEECNEVVSYLKNSTQYEAAGAQIPKGILLEGPPGTGKTLIAKAIASECDANFVSVASSEFVEVFVGLGAQKVRNLFRQARENKPCIIFIDEIDSIGKQRGTGINLGNDEREQTLNQLLAEMDGFNQNDDILIIAATNRKDVLDSALLRPGRFDRLITVPLPDKQSRKDIFKVHTQNKQLSEGIQYELLAELSEGFSGAQIKNLVNEAAILAAREGRQIIVQDDLQNALEKIVVGIAKRTDSRSPHTRYRVAMHEIGHAFLAAYFKQYFELKKVTIQATYNGAGGYTLFNERPEVIDGGLYTKEILKKRLVIAMGGKVAETLQYGENFVSLGAVQDLKSANQLAQSMIGNYGMGDELKVFYNENTEGGRNPFLGRSLGMGGDKYSEKTKEKMDKESLALVKQAYKEAFAILTKYNDTVQVLCKELMAKETMSGSEVVDIVLRSQE